MKEQQEKIKFYFTPDAKKLLNQWEKKFITSLYQCKKEWSEKQNAVLNKLIEKYKLNQVAVVHTITYLPYDDSVEKCFRQTITTREFRRKRGINFNKNKKGNNAN